MRGSREAARPGSRPVGERTSSPRASSRPSSRESRSADAGGNRARAAALHGVIAQAHARTVQDGVRGSGRPLDPATRLGMEQSFGEDFGDVRLHDGPQARRSAQALNANAFTFGPHIVFEQARFGPDRHEDRRLLAHELGHVVQQRRGREQGSREPSTAAHEQDAHAAADQMMAGQPARVQRTSGPQPQRDEKKKKYDASTLLPPQLVADLKKQGLIPADAEGPTTYGDLPPDWADAANAYFSGKKPALPSGPSLFVFPFQQDDKGSTPFFLDPAPKSPLGPFLDPTMFPWEYTPSPATPAPKKKPAPQPQPLREVPVMTPPGGFPITQDSIEALDDDGLYLEMKRTLEWLQKHKESSTKVQQVARYYQGLSRAYNHRKSALELKRSQHGPKRSPQEQVLLQNVRINLRAELAPAFATATDEIVMPPEVLDMMEARDESFPPELRLPGIAGGAPGQLGFFSVLDTAPTAQPRFLDNFSRFGYDGMSQTYVLTFADGTEVVIAKRVLANPAFDPSQAIDSPNSGVYVFKAKGGSNLGITLPPRLDARSLPNLFGSIEENRQAIENADAGAFVGRNLLTYEDIPGSDTIGKITFGLSVARAATPIGVGAWSRYQSGRNIGGVDDFQLGPHPPAGGGASAPVPFQWKGPNVAMNDNDIPMTPPTMVQTANGGWSIVPIPQARPQVQLRLLPTPDGEVTPWLSPFNVPMASAGGGGGGGGWSFGWGGGFRPAPTTDVSSAKLSVGGSWSAQNRRQEVLKAQEKQLESEVAAEIDRINTRRSSISASEWRDQRAGLTKRLYNLREQQHALKIALQKPENIVLTQVRVLGVVDSAGTFSTTEAVAGSGRIPDIGVLQPKGSLRLLDSKTASEVMHSITKRGTPQLKPSSPIGKQVAKEDALRAHGGDWVLQGTDVATGESFTFRMSSSEVDNSRPVPYGQHEN